MIGQRSYCKDGVALFVLLSTFAWWLPSYNRGEVYTFCSIHLPVSHIGKCTYEDTTRSAQLLCRSSCPETYLSPEA